MSLHGYWQLRTRDLHKRRETVPYLLMTLLSRTTEQILLTADKRSAHTHANQSGLFEVGSMVAMRDQLVAHAASRNKYSSLHRHLLSVRPEPAWRTTFGETEVIVGYRLLDPMRSPRPLWFNSKVGVNRSNSLPGRVVGLPVREVAGKGGTPVLAFPRDTDTPKRSARATQKRPFDLDKDFPPWDPGPWPDGFTVSREEIYDETGRLIGGPEDTLGGGC